MKKLSQPPLAIERMRPHFDALYLIVAYAFIVVYCSFAKENLCLSILLVFPLAPLTIMFYAQTHRHYHSFRKNNLIYDLIGILYAGLSGYSWVLYRKHHANHHRYNNGPGDWSQTCDLQGKPRHGGEYIFTSAIKPFSFHLIPYLNILSLRRKDRTLVAWLDESFRTMLRLTFFMLFGWQGFIVLLTWQAVLVVMIIYMNYLQHCHVAPGHGTIWPSVLFNYMTAGTGYHDQHHAMPHIAGHDLLRVSTNIQPQQNHLFNPLAFLSFLRGKKY